MRKEVRKAAWSIITRGVQYFNTRSKCGGCADPRHHEGTVSYRPMGPACACRPMVNNFLSLNKIRTVA